MESQQRVSNEVCLTFCATILIFTGDVVDYAFNVEPEAKRRKLETDPPSVTDSPQTGVYEYTTT